MYFCPCFLLTKKQIKMSKSLYDDMKKLVKKLEEKIKKQGHLSEEDEETLEHAKRIIEAIKKDSN
jgi:ElaB/YqjD/DUF883 family membrane-anchored ribosome-binding protein